MQRIRRAGGRLRAIVGRAGMVGLMALLAVAAGTGGAAQAQDPERARVAPTGVLRAALIASNPVLVSRDADGRLGGVSVELARALGAALGVPVQLVPFENPARYNESLGTGAWDVGLAARDPSRAEFLLFSEPFMEVDNGYAARPGFALGGADEADRAGIRIAVAQGSAPDAFLSRTLRQAALVRVPGGLGAAVDVLATGRADLYGENLNLAHRIVRELPGATVVAGRFNRVQMAIAVPKTSEAALPAVNRFVADAGTRDLIARAIVRAGLSGVRPAVPVP